MRTFTRKLHHAYVAGVNDGQHGAPPKRHDAWGSRDWYDRARVHDDAYDALYRAGYRYGLSLLDSRVEVLSDRIGGDRQSARQTARAAIIGEDRS
jgi:hypothetical protein